MVKKEFIQPAGLFRPAEYTHVVTARCAKMIFVAGQVAYDQNFQLVGEGDLRKQTKQVFENLGQALAAGGATFEDVVKLAIYVVNYKPGDRTVIVDVRKQFISSEHPPAVTLLGVQSLAREGLLIEIEAFAMVD